MDSKQPDSKRKEAGVLRFPFTHSPVYVSPEVPAKCVACGLPGGEFETVPGAHGLFHSGHCAHQERIRRA